MSTSTTLRVMLKRGVMLKMGSTAVTSPSSSRAGLYMHCVQRASSPLRAPLRWHDLFREQFVMHAT